MKTFHSYLVLLGLLQFGFGSLVLAASPQPLPPDQAFKFSVSVKDAQTLIAQFKPAKDHYIYKSKVRFAVKNASGVLIREVRLPAGETKKDPFLGTMEVYTEAFRAEIALDRTPKTRKFTLIATYQGCNEKIGLCYSPIDKSVDLVLP